MSEMSEDSQYELRLCDYRKRNTYVNSSLGLIKQLLQNPYPYNWKIIDELIGPLLQNQTQNKSILCQIAREMQRSIKQVKTLTLLMYLYQLKKLHADIFTFYNIYWKLQYEDIAIQLGDLSVFNSWVGMHWKCKIVQESLWVMIRTLPAFIKQQNINFGQSELNSIIEWITYFQTFQPDTDKYIDSCQLIKLAKQTRLASSHKSLQDKTQHMLFRKILQICSQCPNPSTNLFFFIYPMPFMENQITYFCQIYSDFITNLGQDGLCNIFKGFTKGALCKESLLFILKISHILANSEEFYKLRYLYQNYVLPFLIRNGKACNRVYEHVFEIGSLYVLGFLKHCDIGEQGMQCLIKNMAKIKNQAVQSKWILLCSSICIQYPDLKSCALKMLKQQFKRDVQLVIDDENSVMIEHPQCIWQITLRNGRKHKKYNKVASKMLGIYNRNNQCYIISIVQGLHKSGYLQGLLDKYKQQIKGGAFKLLDQFRILFGQVSGTRKTKEKISVSYLKRLSPQPFNKSQHQEDAYEFLIKIVEMLECELQKVPGMIDQFKKIFEIDQTSTIRCQKCKFSTQKQNKTYIVTIPNKKILSDTNEQSVIDFTCQNCKQKGHCIVQTKIRPKNKIIIVHINRFSQASDGSLIKQLSTQRILRNFINYDLIGMVVHKGKKIDRGHYVYYHRLNSRRWALFNDNQVEEFQLEQEYEQFEREWKSEMAPYILFYRAVEQNN